MNDIQSIGGLATATTLREFAHQSPDRAQVESTISPDDQVEISELARVLSRFAELPEGRARRIVDIRRAIQDGTYVTEDKLNIATDRLLADL